MPHYAADLARIHHEHFGMVAEAAAAELMGRLAKRGAHAGTLVDLAAGSGILSRRARDAGFDVVAVDISPDMLRLARAHAPGAELIQGSLWEVDLPSCVAVVAVGEAFNYATETDAPDMARLEARFETIGRSLAPNGLLLFDVATPGRSGPDGIRRALWEKDQTVLCMQERQEPGTASITRNIDVFVRVGNLYRRATERHRLVLYRPEDVTAALERSGFAVERLDGYADFRFLPGWTGFAATKR